MIGFLIKKVFFDIWDNLMMIIVTNLGFLAPLALILLSGFLADYSVAASVAVLVISILVFSLYSLGINATVFGYSRYRRDGFRAFKEAFRYHLGHAFFHFGLCIILVLLFAAVIPFYFAIGNFFGFFMGMVVFWIALIVFLAMQFFFPLCFHVEADGPFKTFKKCFLVAGDNFGTSLFLLLRTIIDMLLTILTATMIPGFTGIALSRMDTMKLLMKKYDFLDANPNLTKKDLNWEDLLFEERELVGPRSLKGMIFPWKD